MNPQGWTKQERRGVKTSYLVATSGSIRMQEVTFIFKTGKFKAQKEAETC